MHTTKSIGNTAGTSLIELVIALFITSIVTIGAYQAYQFFTISSTREKQKAELQRDIITVSNIIERDIRMAGCGLPGNGVSTHLVDEENDHLSCYSNEQRLETTLTTTADPAHTKIIVADAAGFVVNGYVCLADPPDTCYRRITRIGIYAGGEDTLVLSRAIYYGPFDYTTTHVYPATKFSYKLTGSPTPSIQRLKNNAPLPLGGKLDSIIVILKNAAGNPVGASVGDAAVVMVVVGGHIGNGGNRVFLADSTEVNIRNVN
ncbi:MAG: hypothetical protein JW913_03950 [Chitinispirillaceae bacterium]|nr:hypothetical protein [Chitinispirillaceae bacterium]